MSLTKFLLSSFLLFTLLLWPLKEVYAFEREETTESNHHTVQISSLLPSSTCNPSTKVPSRRGSLKVVHKHGPCSQLGDEDEANAPTAAQILSQDQARVNSVHHRLAFNAGTTRIRGSNAVLPAISGLSLGSANYVVTIGLGTPKKALSLIFDTGSDFTWTQCQPCARSCYKQKEHTFDPSKSTSYANISCNTALCSQVRSATSTQPGCSSSTCVYGVQYGDNSFSIGYFAKEKLTLTPTDVFDNFYFGCGQNNRGLFGSTAGLIGLGRDKLSIVSQTGQKYGKYFSYCLPTPSGSAGHLTFGKDKVPGTLNFTPLLTDSRGPSFYFIAITGISVGGRQLSISPSVFKTAGAIIDSGTVITRLPPAAYSPLRTAFREQMKNYTMTVGMSILDTCYDFSNTNVVYIPKISFFFNGNVKVDIDASGIIYAVKASQVCLAFAGNSDETNVGIFGNIQQQTLEVVYDVAGGKLGFSPGGCD